MLFATFTVSDYPLDVGERERGRERETERERERESHRVKG